MMAHNLQYAARVLQGWIGQRPPFCIALIVPTALISICLGCWIKSGEKPIEVFCIAKVPTNERRSVRIIHHVIVEIALCLKQMANDGAQENNIASCASGDI